jgi:hypothetical protein
MLLFPSFTFPINILLFILFCDIICLQMLCELGEDISNIRNKLTAFSCEQAAYAAQSKAITYPPPCVSGGQTQSQSFLNPFVPCDVPDMSYSMGGVDGQSSGINPLWGLQNIVYGSTVTPPLHFPAAMQPSWPLAGGVPSQMPLPFQPAQGQGLGQGQRLGMELGQGQGQGQYFYPQQAGNLRTMLQPFLNAPTTASNTGSAQQYPAPVYYAGPNYM